MQKNKLHFQHILQALENIERCLTNPRFAHTQQDALFTDILTRELGVIAKSINRLDEEFQKDNNPIAPYEKTFAVFLAYLNKEIDVEIVQKQCFQDLKTFKKDIKILLKKFK